MAKSIGVFLISGAVLVIGAPMTIYFIKFHGPLSDDPAVWGAFGDFMNPFIALLSVLAFIYLTYLVARREHKREQKRLLLPKILEAERHLGDIEGIAQGLADCWPISPRNTVNELQEKAADFRDKYRTDFIRAGIGFRRLDLALLQVRTIEAEAAFPYAPNETISEESETDVKNLLSEISKVKTMINEYLVS